MHCLLVGKFNNDQDNTHKEFIFNQEVINEIVSLQFIPEVGNELDSLSKTNIKLKSLINKLQNNYKSEYTLYSALNTFKLFNGL